MENPVEVDVGEHVYRIGQMDVIKQFHVVRKLAPIIAAWLKSREDTQKEDKESFLKDLMVPILEAFGKMSVEDSEFILFTCLGVVSRKEGEKWVRMMNGNRMQYADTPMPHLMRLAFEVIKENLAGFFITPP